MNNSRANPEDARVQDGYRNEYDGKLRASPVGSIEPTKAEVMPVSPGLCDELEEDRMLIGVQRWADLLTGCC
jgi:hypothetical protein